MAAGRQSGRTKGFMGADAGVQFALNAYLIGGDGAPSDGTSGTGAGYAGPGSLYSDTTNGKLYVNTNTEASPTWTVVGTQS